LLTEILVVVVLTVINGVLAMSELAVVSSRPARLKVLSRSKASKGAAEGAQARREDPGKLPLDSVQIGITLVGVLSGAFSGATLGARLSRMADGTHGIFEPHAGRRRSASAASSSSSPTSR
jgi:putative hemolysin